MKKTLSIILAFILAFSLVACGKKLPNGFDQKLYDYATAAYELVRDYNLGKISKDDAQQRASAIQKNVNALKPPQNNTKLSDELFELKYETNQLSISISLNGFILSTASGSSTVEYENRLKKLLEQ